MSRSNVSLSRRQFLGAAAALAVPAVVSASALGFGRPAPSERIVVGVVGLGSRGFNLIDELLGQPTAEIITVCDVDSLHYRDRPWGKGRAYGRDAAVKTIEKHYAEQSSGGTYGGCSAVSDFRDVCARKDVDAVVVATPDHWHALVALAALGDGKDLYCEKPVTHLFHEGQILCREVARRGAVFQAGSQQRSDARFRQAVEIVRNGLVGKVRQIEVGLPEGYGQPQGDPTVQDPPPHLDYDFWCGPAEKLPYMRARHHRWWRGNRAYGGGTLMDWIGHHNDIAHWSLDMDRGGPETVEAATWVPPETDIYNTPFHFDVCSQYRGGVTISIADKYPNGVKWIGDDGWLFVTRGKMQASDPRWAKLGFEAGPVKVEVSENHMGNFLACIKSRQPCIAPAETAHRSITPGHLGYVAHAVGRTLKWDAQREQILGDDEAEKLLMSVTYRKPWVLPG